MASLNCVQLIGNVGKAPEIKSLNSGDRVANFSLAMGETWKDKNSGEKKERTEWMNIVIWGDGLVGVIERYVNKGSRLYVCGALQTRKYEQNGVEKYTTEVVLRGPMAKVLLLDGAKSERADDSSGYEAANRSGSSQTATTDAGADLDDEIPF